MSDRKEICCICGKQFEGYGNNPYPIKETGRCCNICDNTVVIHARIAILVKSRKASK